MNVCMTPVRGAAVVACVLAISAAGCGGPGAPAPAGADAPALTVGTGRVSVTPMATYIDAGGTLAARESATIASRVMAPVADVAVRAGDRVARGTVLVRLDAADLAAAESRAQADLAASRLTAQAAASTRDAALARRALAQATHDRIVSLFADRSATAQERDEAVASLRAAEAQAAAAGSAADAASRAVDAADAALRAAALTASWAVVAAPFGGVVAERHVDPGTLVTPGTPLVTLESAPGLELVAQLDASRAAALAPGQAADVRVETGGRVSEWHRGRVVEIARVEKTAQRARVTVALDHVDPAWRSGFFGRARFPLAATDRLTVPAAAIVARGQLTFVFVLGADGRARLRAVSVAEGDQDRRPVLSGLSEGEIVVLAPPATLTDGGRVTAQAGGRL